MPVYGARIYERIGVTITREWGRWVIGIVCYRYIVFIAYS